MDLEETYLFPMLKSSHVAKGAASEKPLHARDAAHCRRRHGLDTTDRARTWDYLNAHAGLLNKRGSSIYRNRPPFSIFGVALHVRALEGRHQWLLQKAGVRNRWSVQRQARRTGRHFLLLALPDESAGRVPGLAPQLWDGEAFYKGFVFWDSKRPITADLLRRLDLRRLARN